MVLNGKYSNKIETSLIEATEVFNIKFQTNHHFNSWSSFFTNLLIEIKKQDLSETPFILFIDEFPWLNPKSFKEVIF